MLVLGTVWFCIMNTYHNDYDIKFWGYYRDEIILFWDSVAMKLLYSNFVSFDLEVNECSCCVYNFSLKIQKRIMTNFKFNLAGKIGL